LRIKVFIAQDQTPVAFKGALRRNPKGAGMADVQQTSGRRG